MTQLSIVFQGPVFPSLQDNLRRTRRVYPEAEIIVSTWHASAEEDARLRDWLAVSGIRLVLSDDPGPLTGHDASGEWSTNINRMLLSSRAGLAAATHPLAVKLRTDSWLSDRTLSVLLEQVLSDEQMPARDPDYCVFHSRVMTATWFARDARGSLPLLFHPGDIMLAGRTEDVALFFNAPPAGASLFRPAIAAGLWSAWQYVPEQWLWVNAIHQATNKDVFAGNFHHTPGLVESSERYFLANFVPYSPRKLGLHWPKYWRRYPLRGLFSLYTHTRWRRLDARLQGRSICTPWALASGLLTLIWRTGYRLRARLLRHPRLRAIARNLFTSHR